MKSTQYKYAAIAKRLAIHMTTGHPHCHWLHQSNSTVNPFLEFCYISRGTGKTQANRCIALTSNLTQGNQETWDKILMSKLNKWFFIKESQKLDKALYLLYLSTLKRWGVVAVHLRRYAEGMGSTMACWVEGPATLLHKRNRRVGTGPN